MSNADLNPGAYQYYNRSIRILVSWKVLRTNITPLLTCPGDGRSVPQAVLHIKQSKKIVPGRVQTVACAGFVWGGGGHIFISPKYLNGK